MKYKVDQMMEPAWGTSKPGLLHIVNCTDFNSKILEKSIRCLAFFGKSEK